MDEISVRSISREEYSQFLDKVPHSAFHRIAWLDAVADAFKLHIRLLGYFRNENLLAITPLMGRRIGPLMIWGAPLRKCATPAATVFCSPADFADELIVPLRDWVAGQRISYFQATLPGIVRLSSFAWDKIEALDNLELNLAQPIQEIWKSLAQQKSSVRKAIRMGVRAHWRNGTDMLKTQRELIVATYDKQGIHPNIPERLYEKLLMHQTAIGLRVLCAIHAEQVVAAIWVLSDSQKCYYWDAAALDVARNLNANHLLVWCLIRWAHRKQYRRLDFVGSGRGRSGDRPGIGRFKQSMGGRMVQYRVVYWYFSLMRVALSGYRLINNMRARMRMAHRGKRANKL